MSKITLGIKDFQSIQKTLLTFEPGITVVTGPTNSGKTALFRAAQSAIFNPPYAKHDIRDDEKEAVVFLHIEGFPKIVWRRKKTSVEYEVDGNVHIKAGRNMIWDFCPGFPLIKEASGTVLNFHSENEVLFPFNLSPQELFKQFEQVMSIDDSTSILKTMKGHFADRTRKSGYHDNAHRTMTTTVTTAKELINATTTPTTTNTTTLNTTPTIESSIQGLEAGSECVSFPHPDHQDHDIHSLILGGCKGGGEETCDDPDSSQPRSIGCNVPEGPEKDSDQAAPGGPKGYSWNTNQHEQIRQSKVTLNQYLERFSSLEKDSFLLERRSPFLSRGVSLSEEAQKVLRASVIDPERLRQVFQGIYDLGASQRLLGRLQRQLTGLQELPAKLDDFNPSEIVRKDQSLEEDVERVKQCLDSLMNFHESIQHTEKRLEATMLELKTFDTCPLCERPWT